MCSKCPRLFSIIVYHLLEFYSEFCVLCNISAALICLYAYVLRARVRVSVCIIWSRVAVCCFIFKSENRLIISDN